MAQIFKRGKTWSYRVSYLDEHGERHQPIKGGFRTRRAAVAAASEIEDSKRHGADLTESTISLVDYWNQWIDLYKKGKHTLVTEKRYAIFGNTLADYFGNRELAAIRPTEWQKFLNAYGKTHARETVSKLNSYARAMVHAAMNDQITRVDFTLGSVLTGDRGKSEADKFLQADEFQTVMNIAYDRADYAHITSCIIYLGAVSGARYSELVGLTWKDIDWEASTVNINKTWDYHYNQGFMPTKTPSSVRKIDVPSSAMTMLKSLKSQQAAFYLRTGTRDPNNMVFRTKMGTVPTDAAANKALHKIEDWAEEKLEHPLPNKITFHGLRHSHVSYLLSEHVDIYYISKRLGHSDITTTQRIYSHLLDTLSNEQIKLTISSLEKLSAH